MFTNLYQLQSLSEFDLRQHQAERVQEPVLETSSLTRVSPTPPTKVLSFKHKLITLFGSKHRAPFVRTTAV